MDDDHVLPVPWPLRPLLFAAESDRAFAYDDKTGARLIAGHVLQGNLSLGVGRNLSAKGIRPAERDLLLANDMADAMRDAWALFGAALLRLDPVRQAALADMAFNLGRERLSGFHDLIAAIDRGDLLAARNAIVASAYYRERQDRADRNAGMVLTGILPASIKGESSP